MTVGATELVEQFKIEATKAGAIVYEAKDAKDARNYVLKLAQEHNVKHIVKSKSMLTEEIGLNEHLEDAGIEVRETDIRAWIAQLAGKRPIHMIKPAMHKTIEQIAALISKATGEALEPDSLTLVNAARRTLRQSYIDTVVTNCAPCLVQIRGGLDKRKSNIKVMHSTELLAKTGYRSAE